MSRLSGLMELSNCNIYLLFPGIHSHLNREVLMRSSTGKLVFIAKVIGRNIPNILG